MSKTQKIILIIGASLIVASLLLLGFNTIFQRNENQNPEQVSINTNLFSLFERPIRNREQNESGNQSTPDQEQTQTERERLSLEDNSIIQDFSDNPAMNFYVIEKVIDQLSFTPDQKTPTTKITKSGVRYMGLDGIVYEKFEDEAEIRVSTTISPRLGEGFVYKDSVVFRFSREDMQTIETFIGSISKKEGSVGGVSGSYLAKNFRNFAVNDKNGTYAGILTDDSRNSAQIIVGSLEKSQSKSVAKFNFTDWLLDWFDENSIVMTTRPSALVMGHSYILNTLTGSFRKIDSGMGLTTKTLPFNAGVLISKVVNGEYSTNLFADQKNNFLPFKTIADKCTSISKEEIICGVPIYNTYPLVDDWYKGEFNHSDSIVAYNTRTGTQRILYSGQEGVTAIDIDLIKSSTKGDSIIFRNKIDGYLYRVKVN